MQGCRKPSLKEEMHRAVRLPCVVEINAALDRNVERAEVNGGDVLNETFGR